MAAIYARADLAISAAGGAAWEMAASGLPAALVPVAANQLPGAGYLADAGAALRVDDPTAIAGEGFAAQVRDLLADRPRLGAMASAGRLTCDGKGPHRVLGILSTLGHGLEGNAFCLRRAAPDDMKQEFRLDNDPDVRGSSFSPAAIALENHARWFAARLEAMETVISVLDLEGVVAAMVRNDRFAEDAEIDIAVHKAFRGRGLGVHILQASALEATRYQAVPRLRAVVMVVSAGIYILSPLFVSLVSPEEVIDMPDLLARGKELGLRIGLFPLHEYWTDIGLPEDFDNANFAVES